MSVTMRVTLYVVGGICLLSVFVLHYVVFPSPTLACDSTEHNFGVVPADAQMSHTFILRNTGGRPLHITNIVSSCMCAKASTDKSTINPGEYAELTVELRLDRDVDFVPGRILVESNDPGHPKTLFKVTAIPPQRLMVLPPLIDIGTLNYDQLGDKTVDLEVLCSDPKVLSVHVDDILSPSPLYARLSNLDGPGRPRLQVSLKPGAPIGPLTGVVRVTEGADRKDLKLSVRGEVTGPIRVQPVMAYFGLVKPGVATSKRLAIVAAEQHELVRVEVAHVSKHMFPVVRSLVIEAGKATYLDIQLQPVIEDGVSPEVRGAVQLRCELGDGRDVHVSVPVHFFLGR